MTYQGIINEYSGSLIVHLIIVSEPAAGQTEGRLHTLRLLEADMADPLIVQSYVGNIPKSLKYLLYSVLLHFTRKTTDEDGAAPLRTRGKLLSILWIQRAGAINLLGEETVTVSRTCDPSIGFSIALTSRTKLDFLNQI